MDYLKVNICSYEAMLITFIECLLCAWDTELGALYAQY